MVCWWLSSVAWNSANERLKFAKIGPVGRRWAQIDLHVIREYSIEQVPLTRVKCEGIEVDDLNDSRLVLFDHGWISSLNQLSSWPDTRPALTHLELVGALDEIHAREARLDTVEPERGTGSNATHIIGAVERVLYVAR